MRKLTVVLDSDELYTAVKVEAARRNRSLRDIVSEALREWLEAQEDAELIPLIEAARKEWQEKGGIEAREFFGRLDEEERSRAV